MSKLVTKFKYLKPGRKKKAGGYAKYIGTREGVEIMLINALNISADEVLRDYLSSTVKVTNHVFTSMLEDCSVFETRVLEDVLRATKKAMREHSRYGSARRE